jgi:transcriptional regulator with XRE-family HTH domain
MSAEPVSGAELLAARQQLGLTVDQMAAEIGVTPHVYEAWERGKLRAPPRQNQMAAYVTARLLRDHALATSGLAECDWVQTWWAVPEPKKHQDQVARIRQLYEHSASCGACQARERFISERFGPMPEPPRSAFVTVLGKLGDTIGRLPPWARPVAWGGLILGAWSVVRGVLAIPAIARDPSRIGAAFGAIGVAVGAGAIAGLTYSLIGRPLRRVRILGPYLAGIAATVGYMGALATASLFTDNPMVQNRSELAAMGMFGVVGGIVVGFLFFRRPPAETRDS